MVTSAGVVIRYSDTYCDDQYEYRHVVVPIEMVKLIRKLCGGDVRLMKQCEWSQILAQHRSWEHYAIHRPEPHVLLFRRPKGYIEEEEHDVHEVENITESHASKFPAMSRKSSLREQNNSNHGSHEEGSNRYTFTADDNLQYSPSRKRVLLLAPTKRASKTSRNSSLSSPKRLEFGDVDNENDITSSRKTIAYRVNYQHYASNDDDDRKHRRIRGVSTSSFVNTTASHSTAAAAGIDIASHESLSITTL